VRTASSTAGAIDQLATTSNERVLITGSLHFAGEALAILSGHADEVEDCLQ
jgi:folylpolyglutamate synthase/dihydropteroate synthase